MARKLTRCAAREMLAARKSFHDGRPFQPKPCPRCGTPCASTVQASAHCVRPAVRDRQRVARLVAVRRQRSAESLKRAYRLHRSSGNHSCHLPVHAEGGRYPANHWSDGGRGAAVHHLARPRGVERVRRPVHDHPALHPVGGGHRHRLHFGDPAEPCGQPPAGLDKAGAAIPVATGNLPGGPTMRCPPGPNTQAWASGSRLQTCRPACTPAGASTRRPEWRIFPPRRCAP